MKKIVPIIVGLISFFLIFLSIFGGGKNTANSELDFKNESFVLDEKNGIKYESLYDKDSYSGSFDPGSIDGIYYFSENKEKKPFQISKNSNNYKIKIEKGIFLFSLNDVFNKYELSGDNFSLKMPGNGYFFVNTNLEKPVFYSFSSVLELTNSEKKEEIIKIFPSFYFIKNSLKEEGMISQDDIKNFNYLDFNDSNFNNILCGSDKESCIKLLELSKIDIKKNTIKYGNQYKELLTKDFQNPISSELLTKNPSLLSNEKKKTAYLKNELLRSILKTFSAIQSNKINEFNSSNKEIKNTLEQMKFSDFSYNEGLLIIKKYFYAYFYGNTIDLGPSLINGDKIGYSVILKENFNSKQYNEQSLEVLSLLYNSYLCDLINQNNLEVNLNTFFSSIIDTKINQDNYIDFVFFMSKYLSSNLGFTAESYSLFNNLVKLNNKYLKYLTKDKDLYKNISLSLENYSLIVDGFYSNIIDTYFDSKTDTIGNTYLVLKDRYVSGSSANIPKNVYDSLSLLISLIKQELDIKGKGISESNVDQFYLNNLKKSLARVNFLFFTIISNYGEYSNNLNLNDPTKTTNSLALDDTKDIILSEGNLKLYLQQFINLDITSLKINNDYIKDNYYNISINYSGPKGKFEFIFDLYPRGNYVNNFVMKNLQNNQIDEKFKELSVSLEQKKEFMKKKEESAENEQEKEKYNFANIFEILYLTQGTTTSIVTNNIDSNQDNSLNMPIEVGAFVQDKLINGDFKNISENFPIGFSNIDAKIENNYGWYKIDLHDITKTYKVYTDSYKVTFFSKYVFTEHKFYKLNFFVKKEDGKDFVDMFDGVQVKILPIRLGLLEFKNEFTNFDYYLAAIIKKYNGEKEIGIDFEKKTVILGQINYPVDFNTKID